MNEAVEVNQEDGKNVKIVYILYLSSIILGITGLIGLIMAYMNRKDAPEWLQSHYQFQIRTFWIGLLYCFIGVLTSIVIIGWFIILFYLVWLIIRCVKGMGALDKGEALENPTSWMFG